MFNVFSLPPMIYHYIGMTKMTRGHRQRFYFRSVSDGARVLEKIYILI